MHTTKPGRMCQCDKWKKQATCEAGGDDKTNHEGDSIWPEPWRMIQILKCGDRELGIPAKRTGCQLTLAMGQAFFLVFYIY